MLQQFLTFFEKRSFGVCAYLGERFNISISKIRLFFIYSSFLAVGFPLIVYVFAAIVLDVRHYIKRIRDTVWDF
ncbi:Phage shock protein PspC (stress-responsive transcriptional regulator) [Daejeonella rubra]|uniref:Phage shock protein PspC (Stress-responsive transcriptional regulator) n=1 Tax=Daejeonella rubra TaxID=990371 RepID=A0A1G9QJM9_9SPHI|nr:PspC domain-containing protein [Daejeonella rubra]SDM11199.1 Phage shock protein PspC (stress-responsive transcriptional regulator) [Daejeonella rubra]